jgi:hypothetical protein
MIRKARQLGLLTTPYVFNAEEAKLMAAVRLLQRSLSTLNRWSALLTCVVCRVVFRRELILSSHTWASRLRAPSAHRLRSPWTSA